MTTAAVIQAIEDAQATWTGANWTHETGDREWIDGRSEPVYCTGEIEGCPICEEAISDAAGASDLGDEAIAALRRDDVDAAETAVEAAAAIEGAYGDTPAWGDAVYAVHAMQR